VSAVTGEGIDALLRCIDERLARNNRTLTIEVPAEAGALMHWLHGNTEVLDRQTNDAGATVYRIRVGEALRGRLAGQLKRAGLAPPPS
jgi:GTP-binding protein HflX